MHRLPEKQDDLHPVMDSLSSSSLGKIIQKAKWLLAIDQHLKTILPEAFRAHCQIMNVHHHELILGVDNAAIATRVQLMSAELIRELQKTKEFAKIGAIHCRVWTVSG